MYNEVVTRLKYWSRGILGGFNHRKEHSIIKIIALGTRKCLSVSIFCLSLGSVEQICTMTHTLDYAYRRGWLLPLLVLKFKSLPVQRRGFSLTPAEIVVEL